MLAPLGAFGSAAPVAQQRGLRRVGFMLGLLQTPDPQTDPALSADRSLFASSNRLAPKVAF